MSAADSTGEVGPDVPYPRAVARFPVVRQSTLSAFDACALESHFEMSYRHGTNEHHQARGQLFHRFAARAMREMQLHDEETIEVDVALAILDEVIAQDDADAACPHCGDTNVLPGLSKKQERTCGGCGGKFESEFVNVPRKHIKDLVWVTKKWAKDNRFDTKNIIDIEKRLNVSVRYSLGGKAVERMLTGQIDVLMVDAADPQHAIVLDWKDTWQLPGVSTISDGGFFQQRFYAWLVMSTYKRIERVTLREFYVRKSQPREATLWRLDMDQLTEEFSALVRKFDRAFEHQAFVASPGKHCGWCLRPMACPVPTFTRGEGRITTPAQAKQMAAQLLVAEKATKVAKDALKAYVDLHGPVEVKDAKGKRVYGFVERPRTDRPSEDELREALVASDGRLTNADYQRLFKTGIGTTFVDHAPPEREEGADKSLIDGLAASLERAAVKRGLA